MSTVAELAIVILLPTAAGFAVLGAFRAARWLTGIRRRPVPAEPIERLESRLRRLRAELELTETRSGIIAKNHHVTALRGAYADVLTTACRRLEVSPPPGGDRAGLADIYQAEAALRLRGLDVRQPAAR